MRRAAFLAGAGAALLAAMEYPNSSVAALEARYGGRLGVLAVDTGSGGRIAYRSDERFPMCSTFKVLLVSAVLSRVDAGREQLNRHITYGKAELLEYAPITRAHVAQGFMTVQALCAAAIEYSDNTAANLLLSTIGGPYGVTSYARSIGDSMTRLDRNEPSLNSASPGDVRDTTTPAAMLSDLQELLTGSVLAPPSRDALRSWLIACRTGTDCIRAGIPASWRAGDKTGSGRHATNNDIAVLYPLNRAPIFVTAYYTGSSAPYDARNNVLAEVGRIAGATFA